MVRVEQIMEALGVVDGSMVEQLLDALAVDSDVEMRAGGMHGNVGGVMAGVFCKYYLYVVWRVW